jgi:hypothetical protein
MTCKWLVILRTDRLTAFNMPTPPLPFSQDKT